MPVVRVNRKAASRIESGHPWVFASDILDRGEAQAGDAVRVVDHKGAALGTAHYSSSSQIALRLLSRRIEEIDAPFLRGRIEDALAYRRRVVTDSNACRLVHAEGDRLPGLIVDRYGDWLVMQSLDQGMARIEAEIAGLLMNVCGARGVVARNDAAVRAKENLPLEVRVVAGDAPEQIEVTMNGLRWLVEPMRGQKTGIFLDQRENHAALRGYARGRALDCYSGTGGFALHMAAGCESVEGVDSSERALDTARRNAALNGIANVEFRQADVMDYLPGLIAAHRRFDVAVVDPPAFAKARSGMEGAARGYKEINLRALRLLHRGGILVSCSCSHHMSEAHLLEVIAAAALDCGKLLRVIERRTQARDHPILLTVPETHYLKCLIFEVL